MAKIKSLGGVGMAKIKSLGGVENQNVLNFRGKKLNRLGGVFFNFSRRNFSILVFNFHIGTTLTSHLIARARKATNLKKYLLATIGVGVDTAQKEPDVEV